MSASNWSICPLCNNEEKAKITLAKQYGKISQEEYDELKEQLLHPTHPEYSKQKETVREDYEIYFEGENYVFNGTAECELCFTTWKGKVIIKPELFKDER